MDVSDWLCFVYAAAVVGFETPNKYNILNSNGEIIFQAVEGEFVAESTQKAIFKSAVTIVDDICVHGGCA